MLTDGVTAVSQPVDVMFQLFDQAASPGTQVGATVMSFGVTPTQGRVSIPLDFGPAAFDGTVRWLQVSVRSPSLGAGGGTGGFVALSQRQPVTPTPQALYAARAPWSGLSGVPANVSGAFSPWQPVANSTSIRFINGSVGIGVFVGNSGPAQTLDVRGYNDSGVRLVGGKNSIFNSLGGEVIIAPGAGPAGGPVEIRGGNGNGDGNSTGPGGSVNIFGGQGNGVGNDGAVGGSINLRAGDGDGAAGSGGPGGSITLTAGNSDISGFGNIADPGEVILTAGAGGLFGPDGTVFLQHRAVTSTLLIQRNHFPIRIRNTSQNTFFGGLRINDDGFLDITNNAGANPTTGFARLNSSGSWSTVSDARTKSNITDATGLLDIALSLRPVRYRSIERPASPPELGFLAQDVDKVAPEVVTHADLLTLDYARMSTIAIGAIQELEARHRAEIARRDAENAELRARLERLESLMKK